MRVLTIIVAASAFIPAAAAAHPAPDQAPTRGQADASRDRHPVLMRAPDGSTIVGRTLPAFPAELDAAVFRTPDSDRVAPSPLGRRRSPSEQAIDEDLDRAFEQAAEMARFGAPN
jgi:hypothetical protein